MNSPFRSGVMWRMMILAAVTAAGAAAGAETPATINIHGAVGASDGSPIVGTRAYLVRFYDAASGGSQFGDDQFGFIEISDGGLFNIAVTVPLSALNTGHIWYELGIDTDIPPDGDAADDMFPDRIQVHSVPFALQAAEVNAVDASTIGNGSVDNAEFETLDGSAGPLQAQIDAKAEDADLAAHTGDTVNPHSVTAAQVGLENVDNTADMDKPVSNAALTALDAKADDADLTAHTGDTANPHAVTAAQVGLENVDNTADVDKPVSGSVQTALDAKANTADLTAHSGDTANPHAVTAAQVGLENVDNTADMDKPVSGFVQTALDAKASAADLTAHSGDTVNPHAVTAAQVGLENVDNTADMDKPVSTAAQAALDGKLPRSSEAYVLVVVASDQVTNGTRLREAYAAAKALTPFGNALSATNRAVVLVPPGNYDLGASPLSMDTDYVDLAGLATARDGQYVYRADNVLVQTASDIRIENLVLHYTGSSTTIHAYYPNTTWNDGTDHTGSPPQTRIRNCEFRATNFTMRTGVEYAGFYEDCTSGSRSFGSSGTASGTFTNCTGGDYSFGYNGTASGTFTNCTSNFHAFGGLGTASGTFTNCTGGSYAFGGLGTASGTFTNCTGTNYSFGYGGGTASGIFTNCTGGNYAFGGSNGTASGTFTGCTGGDRAFGGWYSTASGTFTRCTAGEHAFGGGYGDSTGGVFSDCRMTGSSWDGTFAGQMEDCRWNAGFTCGADARIYRSTILGNVNLNSTAAGIAHSAVKGTIKNAGSASFNTANLEDTDVN